MSSDGTNYPGGTRDEARFIELTQEKSFAFHLSPQEYHYYQFDADQSAMEIHVTKGDVSVELQDEDGNTLANGDQGIRYGGLEEGRSYYIQVENEAGSWWWQDKTEYHLDITPLDFLPADDPDEAVDLVPEEDREAALQPGDGSHYYQFELDEARAVDIEATGSVSLTLKDSQGEKLQEGEDFLQKDSLDAGEYKVVVEHQDSRWWWQDKTEYSLGLNTAEAGRPDEPGRDPDAARVIDIWEAVSEEGKSFQEEVPAGEDHFYKFELDVDAEVGLEATGNVSLDLLREGDEGDSLQTVKADKNSIQTELDPGEYYVQVSNETGEWWWQEDAEYELDFEVSKIAELEPDLTTRVSGFDTTNESGYDEYFEPPIHKNPTSVTIAEDSHTAGSTLVGVEGIYLVGFGDADEHWDLTDLAEFSGIDTMDLQNASKLTLSGDQYKEISEALNGEESEVTVEGADKDVEIWQGDVDTLILDDQVQERSIEVGSVIHNKMELTSSDLDSLELSMHGAAISKVATNNELQDLRINSTYDDPEYGGGNTLFDPDRIDLADAANVSIEGSRDVHLGSIRGNLTLADQTTVDAAELDSRLFLYVEAASGADNLVTTGSQTGDNHIRAYLDKAASGASYSFTGGTGEDYIRIYEAGNSQSRAELDISSAGGDDNSIYLYDVYAQGSISGFQSINAAKGDVDLTRMDIQGLEVIRIGSADLFTFIDSTMHLTASQVQDFGDDVEYSRSHEGGKLSLLVQQDADLSNAHSSLAQVLNQVDFQGNDVSLQISSDQADSLAVKGTTKDSELVIHAKDIGQHQSRDMTLNLDMNGADLSFEFGTLLNQTLNLTQESSLQNIATLRVNSDTYSGILSVHPDTILDVDSFMVKEDGVLELSADQANGEDISGQGTLQVNNYNGTQDFSQVGTRQVRVNSDTGFTGAELELLETERIHFRFRDEAGFDSISAGNAEFIQFSFAVGTNEVTVLDAEKLEFLHINLSRRNEVLFKGFGDEDTDLSSLEEVTVWWGSENASVELDFVASSDGGANNLDTFDFQLLHEDTQVFLRFTEQDMDFNDIVVKLSSYGQEITLNDKAANSFSGKLSLKGYEGQEYNVQLGKGGVNQLGLSEEGRFTIAYEEGDIVISGFKTDEGSDRLDFTALAKSWAWDSVDNILTSSDGEWELDFGDDGDTDAQVDIVNKDGEGFGKVVLDGVDPDHLEMGNFESFSTVTEDELRDAVADGSYAVEHNGVEYTFEDSEYNIDTSQVMDMSGLFYGSDFNKDIGYWDVSSVANMFGMFESAEFNQDIGDWDVSSVEDMGWMLYNAKLFEQDLSAWQVPGIAEKPRDFATGSPLEGRDEWHPNWGGIEKLTVTIDSLSTAGEAGSSVHVNVTVEHTGNAGQVEFTVTQDTTGVTERVDLNHSVPAEEEVSWTLEDTLAFDPGAVELEVSVEEDGETVSEVKTFGLYEDEEDRDFEWQWSDPDKSPFDMIGHVVADHDGYDEGWYGTGTGFLISPMHIMTNAHVITDDEDWASDLSELNAVDFFLGRNGGNLFDEQDGNEYAGEHAYLQKDEWGKAWPDTDMAIVTLDREVEGVEHFDWFWNAGQETDRDVTGDSVTISGYPSENIEQGEDDRGNNIYFQWNAQGTATDYLPGYDEYGQESGGLEFSQDMSFAGGASGSPVIRETVNGDYQFVGAYTGSIGADPVAATLDSTAFDWALTVVQGDGYLTDQEYVYGGLDPEDMGPDKLLPGTDTAVARSSEGGESVGIKVQGVPQDELDDYSGLA
ncbi:protein of unknown function DUF285 lipoprotein [Desulfonatronospira thiodismutans ASO3-1]|uniref:Serine protease n=1 Tax=Desulfonatronospira thiodismutans ASO3-1 TaxID=555779 RepID=D6SV46_9BACT|nr:BspA family leucine-rich repeat surface protein [Desulfonatronospira thiodismutans]EFI32802.1 protein of unknown function DUF285 lipoprotein [Desulfonatronospira thiodismutans ASO3-1]